MKAQGRTGFSQLESGGGFMERGALRLGLEEEMRMIIVIMIIISVQHY